MKVTFTKTDKRRYCLSVEGANFDSISMAQAPGYDDRLPHDVAHFIVENELGILGGVFGQIAAGGTANTFFGDAKNPRKARKRGSEIARTNRKDALFSEHAIYAAQSRWEKHDIIPATKIPTSDIERLIAKFQEFTDRWIRLPVGGSITLEWRHSARSKTSRSRKK